MKNGQHNHERSKDIAGHPIARRLKQRGRPVGSKQSFQNEASLKRDHQHLSIRHKENAGCSNYGKIGHNKRYRGIPVTRLDSEQA